MGGFLQTALFDFYLFTLEASWHQRVKKADPVVVHRIEKGGKGAAAVS